MNHSLDRKVFFGILAVLLISQTVFAAADPWQAVGDLLTGWMTGTLGKLLSLVAIIIGVVGLVFGGQSGFGVAAKVVFVVMLIGGSVGLASMFFSLGQSAFGTAF